MLNARNWQRQTLATAVASRKLRTKPKLRGPMSPNAVQTLKRLSANTPLPAPVSMNSVQP